MAKLYCAKNALERSSEGKKTPMDLQIFQLGHRTLFEKLAIVPFMAFSM